MITSDTCSRSSHRNFRGQLLAAFCALAFAVAAFAANESKKNYNLPAGDAVKVLQTFSEQSGEEIVYPVEQVRGVKTNAVKGELTARAALTVMLADTGLSAVLDEKTGALSVKRDSDPNGASRQAGSQTAKMQKSDSGALKLETVTVLGSRIHQTDTEGPSPFSTYDADYIRSTGAMTLADFMNYLPQNYTGIASGRASAPNELNPEFAQRTETTSPAFNFVLGASDSPPAQTGVSGVSLRGLGSGSTLVLVDGRRVATSGAGNRGTDTRQGFVDLNTIPLGMIDHIEVSTDGSSAIYGADAVAGVINIVLKKNWVGNELSLSYKVSEHGGGDERNATLTSGFVNGKLSGTVTYEYYDRGSMKASQREFSANQNHTGIVAGVLSTTGATLYGRDYRLAWGYPAVIQASGGVVSGTFDAIPGVRVVLVPTGATATPTLSEFVPVTTPVAPATVVNASAQRRLNTASYIDLIPESKRTGASANFSYKFAPWIEAYVSLRTSVVRSLYETQPVTSITGGFGTAALLPAAYNPFNQNVTVGMVLTEFGSTNQRTHTNDDTVTAGLQGKVGKTWQWDMGTTWDRQKILQTTRLFNSGGFSALLTAANPAQRFNPFIDASAPGAPSQAALLETLAIYPTLESANRLNTLDFTADGALFDIWGGAVKMAFGGSTSHTVVGSTAVNFTSSSVTPVASTFLTNGAQTSKAAYVEFSVPLFGKPNSVMLLHRFDLSLAGRYESDGKFSQTVPKYGFTWSPVQSLLFRADYSQGFRAPDVTEYLVAPTTTTSTLSDPLRNPTSTPGITVTGGSNPNPQPERSHTWTSGVVYEVPFIKGLNLSVDYFATEQKDTLQQLSTQTIINNEALFPDRVTRAAPNATDIALNQPGQILAVSRVFVNFGRLVNRSLDATIDYTLPWTTYGTWRANVSAARTLEDTKQLAPGQPAVVLDGDTGAPPRWTLNGSLFWHGGAWSSSIFVWYLDGFTSNSVGNTLVGNSTSTVYLPTPAVTKVDLNATYEFKNGIWRGHGKGVRVSAGVNNLFDKQPPFSDTVFGYNGGIHGQLALGRAYQFSMIVPF